MGFQTLKKNVDCEHVTLLVCTSKKFQKNILHHYNFKSFEEQSSKI